MSIVRNINITEPCTQLSLILRAIPTLPLIYSISYNKIQWNISIVNTAGLKIVLNIEVI